MLAGTGRTDRKAASKEKGMRFAPRSPGGHRAPGTPRAPNPSAPRPPGASRLRGIVDIVLGQSRFSTWSPRPRTHLLCVACAGLLTMFSIASMYPLRPEWIKFRVNQDRKSVV